MKNASTTQEHLSITIISHNDAWINDYIPELIKKLAQYNHTVSWKHNISEINGGDLAFFLGYGQLVSKDILFRHKHNLVVHESALPQGKGWSPLTWQILEGKNEIPITLFEAVELVDSGKIYLRDIMRFNGLELVTELRQKQAEYTIQLCLSFVENYPEIIRKGMDQTGLSTFYRKRKPGDSELDPDKTIREQFNLLRVVDNERYPAYFEINNEKFIIRVEKESSK